MHAELTRLEPTTKSLPGIQIIRRILIKPCLFDRNSVEQNLLVFILYNNIEESKILD